MFGMEWIQWVYMLSGMYLGVGLYKLVLVLCRLPVALATWTYLRPNDSVWAIVFFAATTVLLPITSWPVLLWNEGRAFFLIESAESVILQVYSAVEE
jgi:hypothetical protein